MILGDSVEEVMDTPHFPQKTFSGATYFPHFGHLGGDEEGYKADCLLALRRQP